MFSKNGTVLVAILLASSAAATPLSAAQSDGVRAVIDAIKAQLKAENISDGDILVDNTEAHLKDIGFLDDTTMSKLNDQIKSMTSEGGISVDEIAEILTEELRSEDAIQKRDKDGIQGCSDHRPRPRQARNGPGTPHLLPTRDWERAQNPIVSMIGNVLTAILTNSLLQILNSESGISAVEIAEILIEELRSEDAIQKRDQEGVAKALVIDPDLVKRVMARETEAHTFCPPMAQCGGWCCPC